MTQPGEPVNSRTPYGIGATGHRDIPADLRSRHQRRLPNAVRPARRKSFGPHDQLPHRPDYADSDIPSNRAASNGHR